MLFNMAGGRELRNAKITDYFNSVNNSKTKHCFLKCKFGRGDESEDDMTLCDGCTQWFHHACVDSQETNQNVRPRPRPSSQDGETAVWFCPKCRMVFTEVNIMKRELTKLKSLVNSIKQSNKQSEHRTSNLSNNTSSSSTAAGPSMEATRQLMNENAELKEENQTLKNRLDLTNALLNQLLEQESNKSQQLMNSHADKITPTEGKNDDMTWHVQRNKKNKKNNRNNNTGTSKLNKAKATSNNNSQNTNDDQNRLSASPNQNRNGYNGNKTSSATQAKKILLLGDSHVRRLDADKLKKHSITSAGIGGLLSGQLHSRHKQTINSELPSATEVVLHIGSNDISKNIPTSIILNNIDTAVQKLKDINAEIKIAVSSIFLQTYDTAKNIKIVEANQEIRNLCLSHGWDFLDNGKIAFKHLDSQGMHLNAVGNRIFASNLINYAKSD